MNPSRLQLLPVLTLLGLTLGLCPSPASAAFLPAEARLTLSTNEVAVGDLVAATLTVELPPGARWLPPPLQRDPAIVVSDQTTPLTLQTGPVQRVKMSFTFTSFQIGTHRIIAEPMMFRDPEGQPHFLEAPADTLRVISLLTPAIERPADLADLIPPPPPPHQRPLPVLATHLPTPPPLSLLRP